jgi:hypothetical protein
MNLIRPIRDAIRNYSGFRELESSSDALILRVTNIDPGQMPKYWRDEARVVLQDIFRSNREQLNSASAAVIKLAFFCHGYAVIQDEHRRHQLAFAIRRLRASYEGALITPQASLFVYTYVGV